jgi:uncharacterized protein YjbI with pentapeptide repeats
LTPVSSEAFQARRARGEKDFRGACFSGLVFTGDLRGFDFSGARFLACKFSLADLSGARFNAAEIQADFLAVRAALANFTDACIYMGKVQGGEFRYARFRGATLRKMDFSGCDLSDADFTGLRSIDTRFTALKDARGIVGGDALELEANRATASP